MYCSRCGNQVPDGTRFCPNCGARLDASDYASAESGSESNSAYEQTPRASASDRGTASGGPVHGDPVRSSGGSSFGLPQILMILSLVIAAIYAFFAIKTLFNGVLGGIVSLLMYLNIKYFIIWLLGIAASAVTTLAYALMAVLLAVFGLRRTKKTIRPLVEGMCLVPVALLLASVLRIIRDLVYMLMVYSSGGFGAILLNGLKAPAVAAVCVGLIYILLNAEGHPVSISTGPALTEDLRKLPEIVQRAFSSVKTSTEAKNRERRAAQQATQQAAQQAAQQTAYQNVRQGEVMEAAGAPRRLKDDRSLALYILLCIVTCGIYSWFFVYDIARDTNEACAGDGQNTSGLGTFILLSLVTCGIYAFFWEYNLGNRLAANAPRYGLQFQENGTTILLWCLIGVVVCGIGPYVAMYYLIRNSNSLFAAYNRSVGM